MKELINPNISQDQWESLVNLAELLVVAPAYAENPTSQEIAGRLHELQLLLMDFLLLYWKDNAMHVLEELISKEKSQPSYEYYGKALTHLHAFLTHEELTADRKNDLLMLFNMAYHLGFYDYSDAKLADLGDGFKGTLSDNENPQFSAGSVAGYEARLRNYVGGQILFHKDEIAKTISQNIADEAPVVKRRP